MTQISTSEIPDGAASCCRNTIDIPIVAHWPVTRDAININLCGSNFIIFVDAMRKRPFSRLFLFIWKYRIEDNAFFSTGNIILLLCITQFRWFIDLQIWNTININLCYSSLSNVFIKLHIYKRKYFPISINWRKTMKFERM